MLAARAGLCRVQRPEIDATEQRNQKYGAGGLLRRPFLFPAKLNPTRMPLAGRDKLGPYQILESIGTGGMGEVWKATDPRIDRTVAIKICKAQFTDRFDREARAVAALNHPNVCTLYDIGPDYLVMEFVEGETLGDKIKRSLLDQQEILRITSQVADALEEAHSKGVTHRDLKPGNIKIRPDGTVKVLDFGLAKVALSSSSASMAPSDDSPTVSVGLTQAGMILGTAAYMSPEQARGRNVDKRADIWAFGVVLYEMLTGAPPFNGMDMGETLAAVIKTEPEFSKVPRRFERLLRACLQKDPRKRLRDIADWKLLLDSDELARPVPAPPASSKNRLAAGIILGLAFVAVAFDLAFFHFRETSPQGVMRLAIPFPDNLSQGGLFELSPDGRRLAIARLVGGTTAVFLRSLDSQDFQRLSGTDLARGVFWSPDSRYIGFFAGGKLKIVAANGGPPQILCDGGIYAEGTWSRDGIILFDSDSGSLQRTTVGGGECTTLLPALERGTRRGHASFLPDGKHFLFTIFEGAQSGIYIGTLEAPSGHRLLADASPVRFAPRSAGSRYDHILFLRDGNLMAQALDARSFELVGEAFRVAGQATTNLNEGLAASAVSTGVLVYSSGVNREIQQATWVDRSGREIAKLGTPGDARAVALSPDEKTVAINRKTSVSLFDLNRNIESEFGPASSTAGRPVWSPDGSRLVFATAKQLFVKDARGGGKEELLLMGDGTLIAPTDWSRDGRYLLYTKDDPKTHADVWYLEDPLGPRRDLKPKPLVQTEFREGRAQFSPDGRFVAYESEESGQRDVYVRQFPSGPGKWKIATGGTPRWRRDGNELYYLSRPPTQLMAVPVQTGPGGSFQAGEPKKLFDLRINELSEAFVYAPSADGQRFLVVLPASDEQPTLNVITDWANAATRP